MKEYYLGDPGYIIPDEEWSDFCDLLEEHRTDDEHHRATITWHGQTIHIWQDGGDGSWEWDYGIKTLNNTKSFFVDAGIFCVIDLSQLPKTEDNPWNMGMIFDRRPKLRVEDGVVYINNKPDNRVHECDNCSCLTHDSWWDDDSGEMRCENCW